MQEDVSRIGDMHPNRRLKLWRQEDGDIIVTIEQKGCLIRSYSFDGSEEVAAEVEFCTSGGNSPRTREALRQLMEAMELDNKESPDFRNRR